jgi:hypothetical protein
VQQELVIEDIERMEHRIRNLWNIRHRVSGNSLSLFFLDIETAANNSEIYHTEYLQNMRVKIEPPHRSKIIYRNARASLLPHQGVLRTQNKMREMWQITKH